MKKRFLAILCVLCLCATLLAACDGKKSNVITQEKAQQIALDHAGLKESDVTDIHIHVTQENGTPCYNIHFTVNGVSMSYNISATGEVLSAGEGGH